MENPGGAWHYTTWYAGARFAASPRALKAGHCRVRLEGGHSLSGAGIPNLWALGFELLQTHRPQLVCVSTPKLLPFSR